MADYKIEVENEGFFEFEVCGHTFKIDPYVEYEQIAEIYEKHDAESPDYDRVAEIDEMRQHLLGKWPEEQRKEVSDLVSSAIVLAYVKAVYDALQRLKKNSDGNQGSQGTTESTPSE